MNKFAIKLQSPAIIFWFVSTMGSPDRKLTWLTLFAQFFEMKFDSIFNGDFSSLTSF